jgi:hypothetical protein
MNAEHVATRLQPLSEDALAEVSGGVNDGTSNTIFFAESYASPSRPAGVIAGLAKPLS